MDHFGIGAAFKAMSTIYLQSARASGRTVSMLESLNTGDRIIFASQREADRVKRLLREHEKDIECIVVNPQNYGRLLERRTNQGRTIFDHSWVEEYYQMAIVRCEKDIDFFQREMSGFGEAHRETRRAAAEFAKWQV